MYKLENDIPIPNRRAGRKLSESEYPFLKMKIGQSFFVKVDDPQKLMFGRLHSESKRVGVRITCRTAVKRGVKGIRTWRI